MAEHTRSTDSTIWTPPQTTPTPDPTVLTTEQLFREVASLKGSLDLQFESANTLTIEKFRNVETRFDLVESLRIEQKADTRLAVDAALTSTKEAIAKTEAATTEALRQLGETFRQGQESLGRIVSDLKDRVVAMESIKLGSVEQKVEGRNQMTGLYAAIGLASSLILTVLAVIAFAQ